MSSMLHGCRSGHGLFGYSYGGLFSLYAWLRQPGLFASIGAGSPGVLSPDSKVFEMIDDLPALGEAPDAPLLHVTLNEAEMLGDIPVYRGLARDVLDAMEKLRAKGRSPYVSSAMLRETHVTGVQASFLSYLKACHTRVQHVESGFRR